MHQHPIMHHYVALFSFDFVLVVDDTARQELGTKAVLKSSGKRVRGELGISRCLELIVSLMRAFHEPQTYTSICEEFSMKSFQRGMQK